MQQDYIKASVEEYMNRFHTVLDIVGNEVLSEAPESHTLVLRDNPEENALSMREYLQHPNTDAIGNLAALLENKGFLIFFLRCGQQCFLGIDWLGKQQTIYCR